MTERKYCPHCHTYRPLTSLYWEKKPSGEWRKLCKQSLEYYRRHRSKKPRTKYLFDYYRIPANMAKAKERARCWRQEHCEELVVYEMIRSRSASRRTITRQYKRRYKAHNPERRRIDVVNYRARERKAEGCFDRFDIARILKAQQAICFYCPADISDRKHTIDHYIPLTRGGTNWPDNIRLACPSCNYSKADKLPSEFIAWRKARGLPIN